MCKEIKSKDILNKWEEELEDRVFNVYLRDPFLEMNLLILRVGERSDTDLYVRNKIKKAEELRIGVTVFNLPEDTTQAELNQYLMAADTPTILQLPIPEHLNAEEAMSYLDPKWDVDGLTPTQKGKLVSGDEHSLEPATAKGVIRILENEISLRGKRVAIVSRSPLIGQPLAQMILQRDGVPTILHSRVSDHILRTIMKSSDVIVTGCGKRAIFDASYFDLKDQVIIDCSMAKDEDRPGVGDVDKEDVLLFSLNRIASGYGHTGPATVLGLMDNIIKCYEILVGVR